MASVSARTFGVVLVFAGAISLVGCDQFASQSRTAWSKCINMPKGVYSGTSGGKTITLDVKKSPTTPGFKHNVRIDIDPPNWNYTAACHDNTSSLIDVASTDNASTIVTTWTVTDAGHGKVHITDGGTPGTPSPNFDGDITVAIP